MIRAGMRDASFGDALLPCAQRNRVALQQQFRHSRV
jgi:hypothetical protein